MAVSRTKLPTSVRRAKQLAVVVSNPLAVRTIVGALSRGAFREAKRVARTAARTPDLGAEKIVSRTYRFLWLCTPKVASRSTIAALCSVDPGAALIRDKSVSEIYATYPEVKGYDSFAFIRHPIDRALSLYAEIRFSPERYQGEQRIHKEEKRRFFLDRHPGLAEVNGFDDYCQWLNTPYGSDALADRHFLSQHVQIRRKDGRLPDSIGCIENADEDLKRIAARVGMPAPALPLLNTMLEWQPSSPQALKAVRSEMMALVTDRNRALLETRYADDLELYQTVSSSGMIVLNGRDVSCKNS